MSEEENCGSYRAYRTELELRHQALEMALLVWKENIVPQSLVEIVSNAAMFLAFLQHGTVPTKHETEPT
jgi:hypothetical protein